MPSSSHRGQIGLWVRVAVAACVVLTVATALVVFEAAVVALVTYGALSALVGVTADLFGSGRVALFAGLAAYLVVAAVVLGAYRAKRRGVTEGTATEGIVAYAGLALLCGSLAATFLALDALGAPPAAYAVLVALLAVGAYPMLGLAMARDDDPDSDDPPWALEAYETEPMPWDDDSEKPYEVPSLPSRTEVVDGVREAAAGVRATVAPVVRTVGAELAAVARGARERLGTAGLLVVGLLVAVATGGLWTAAGGRSATALVVPLSAAFGALFGLGHAADAVHTTRREDAVVDDLAGPLGPAVDDERTRDLEARVARLAATMDAPTPAVSLRQSATTTAGVVGFRPTASTLVVTTALVDRLSDRELDAVLAHELAHVANRDAAVVTALSAPRIAAERAFYRYGPNPLSVALVAVVSATARLCVAVVSRAREYVADDAAVAATGDPAALASALGRLDAAEGRRPTEDLRGTAAPFSVVPPAWEEHRFFDRARRVLARRVLGTHPPTDRRIERLRARVAAE